tara:strand:- start:519 stop:755 length:237 start_codon:yes stop_codon:yes gene_type:complete
MSYQLYNFLPTEIVWKIYEDLHRSYMVDLNQEFFMNIVNQHIYDNAEYNEVDRNKNYSNCLLEPWLIKDSESEEEEEE